MGWLTKQYLSILLDIVTKPVYGLGDILELGLVLGELLNLWLVLGELVMFGLWL